VLWDKEDLSNYNRAESPWYIVSPNGKVDIGFKQGEGDTKIGLQHGECINWSMNGLKAITI
jgi:hypothetical protein